NRLRARKEEKRQDANDAKSVGSQRSDPDAKRAISWRPWRLRGSSGIVWQRSTRTGHRAEPQLLTSRCGDAFVEVHSLPRSMPMSRRSVLASSILLTSLLLSWTSRIVLVTVTQDCTSITVPIAR